MFLLFALIIAVICAVGAMVAGVRYWMDGWQRSKRLLDDNKCAVDNSICKCTGQLKMPVEGNDGSDLMIVSF